MSTLYTVIKFVHILTAILALGTSAGLGMVLEFYGGHPRHGAFVLRAVERMSVWFVLPGYVLIVVTGVWMMRLAWTPVPWWIKAALALWSIGIAALLADISVLRRQIAAEGAASSRRLLLLGRGLGATFGLIVVAILYLMVFKPAA